MMRTTDHATAATARLRRELLIRCEHLPASVDAPHARAQVAEWLRDAAATPADLAAFWRDPRGSLGPFDALPAACRRQLALAGARTFAELRLATPPAAWLAHGPPIRLATLLLRQGWRAQAAGFQGAGRTLLRIGRRLIRHSREAAGKLHRARRTRAGYEAPFLLHVWWQCGADVAALAEDYVGDLRPDPALSPVYLDPGRGSEAALLIGVDALMHRGRLYFIESNVNPGVGQAYGTPPDAETLGRELARWARDRGRRRLDFYGSNLWTGRPDVCLSEDLERRWIGLAAAEGVELRLIDAPEVGSPTNRPAAGFIDAAAEDTAAVIARDLPSAVSRTLGRKGRLEALLTQREAGPPGEPKLPFPRAVAADGDLPPVTPGGRYPNLIAKDPAADMAQGIRLYNVHRLPAELGELGLAAYEYLAPDPFTGDEPEPGEYASIFRIHLLLTADGPVYLGSRRDVSPVPLPPSLPEGPVADRAPFLANVETGARSKPVSAEECDLCQRFALRLGGILVDYLTSRYEDGLRLRR